MKRIHLSGIGLDARQALRRLRRTPGVVVVSALALGVGAAAVATVYRIAELAFLTPLPGLERQGELVNLDTLGPRSLEPVDAPRALVPELAGLREVLAGVAGFAGRFAGIRPGPGRTPELALAQFVTPDYFTVLRARAQYGRLLDPGRRGEHEVVVSDRAVRRWFGGDAGGIAAVGSTIAIGGRPFTVVGVASHGFEGTFLGVPTAVYLSIDAGAHLLPPDVGLELVGRLAPGVTLAAARQRLAALPARRAEDGTELTIRPRALVGLDRSIAAGIAALLAALATLAFFVLATAAVNVGGLLAYRAVERRGELALRSALGASRIRLLRPLLLEAALVGLAGGVAAIALSFIALRLLGSLAPRFSVPLTLDLTPGLVTLSAAAVLAWILGSAAGLAPVVAIGRSGRLVAALACGRGAPKTQRVRSAFVVGQLALALALVAAGLALVRGISDGEYGELGFDRNGLYVLDLEMQALAGDDVAHLALAEAIERRARESGALLAAGLLDQQPFAPGGLTTRTTLDDGSDGPELAANALSPGTLAALGIELVAGRDFVAGDAAGAPAVAIIDRVAARRLWPCADPATALGRRLRIGDASVEVVGLTAAVRLRRPWLGSEGQLLRPFAQVARGRLALVARSREGATTLQRELMPALAAVAGDLPLDRFVPIEERIDLVQLPLRIAARTGVALAAVAIALATLGLVGLVSRMVADRRHELGIRAALGADRGALARIVLGEGLRLAAWGAVLGLPLAGAVGAGLAALLERVRPAEAAVLGAAAASIALVSLVAAAAPALRAARTAPADSLRYD